MMPPIMPIADRRTGRVKIPDTWQTLALRVTEGNAHRVPQNNTDRAAVALARLVLIAAWEDVTDTTDTTEGK